MWGYIYMTDHKGTLRVFLHLIYSFPWLGLAWHSVALTLLRQ